MVRSMQVGMTDYSHQSLEDIFRDLQGWIESLREVRKLFDHNIRLLKQLDIGKLSLLM